MVIVALSSNMYVTPTSNSCHHNIGMLISRWEVFALHATNKLQFSKAFVATQCRNQPCRQDALSPHLTPMGQAIFSLQTFHQTTSCQYRALRIVAVVLQAHADYEHRLQEEVNARLLKEQELMQLVWHHPYRNSAACVPHIAARRLL